jgi:hypothetical protein
MEELANPAERAQGLINNSLAPADPERSGFPATAVKQTPENRASDITSFFIFINA